jgi:hypothetical protein
MSRKTRLIGLVCMMASLAFAESWSGSLVNSRCYDALESNHNPDDTLTAVDRDRASEVNYCAPNRKTKSFAVITHDGETLRLDPGGNTKAAGLVRTAGKKSSYYVQLTGEKKGHSITTESISLVQ